ncbi:hypothetical protein HAZT_HAZT009086 [Hyalella azteca]|nr:hypothetical protein HAZT_HAZT009086 [Hyalella azteca]
MDITQMDYAAPSVSFGQAFEYPQKPSNRPQLRNVTVRDLDDLIRQIHAAFDSDSVDVDLISAILAAYDTNPAHWRKFAKFDRYK